MNRSFKILFNRARGKSMVVNELTKASGAPTLATTGLVLAAGLMGLTAGVSATEAATDEPIVDERFTSTQSLVVSPTGKVEGSREAGIVAEKLDTYVELTDGAELTVKGRQTKGSRVYGAASESGHRMDIIADKVTVDVASDAGRAVGLRANGGDIAIKGHTDVRVESTAEFAVGLDAWYGAGIDIDGDLTLHAESTAGRVMGMQIFDDDKSHVTVTGQTNATVIGKAETFTHGINANRGKADFEGDVKFDVTGNGITYGVETQSDHDAPTLINFKGKTTEFNVTGHVETVGFRPSGHGDAVNMTGETVKLTVTGLKGNAVGMLSQYGGSLNATATVDMRVAADKTATGISIANFADSFGSASFKTLNADVTSQNGNAFGIRMDEYDDSKAPTYTDHGHLLLQGPTSLTVTAENGTATGLLYKGGVTDIAVDDKLTIDVTGKDAYGLLMTGAPDEAKGFKIPSFKNDVTVTARKTDGTRGTALMITDGRALFEGQSNLFTGDVLLGETASLVLTNGATIVDGDLKAYQPAAVMTIDADQVPVSTAKPTVSLNKASLHVKGRIGEAAGNEGETAARTDIQLQDSTLILENEAALGKVMANGSTVSTAGKIVIDELSGTKADFMLTESAADIAIKTSTVEKMGLTTSGNVTDDLNGDVEALLGKVKVGNAESGEKPAAPAVDQITMEAGKVVGEVTKTGDGPVVEKKNDSNDAKLSRLANLPAMMTRIQMNELRKRMGDIRQSGGDTGVWARYNGGKLSGQYALDADFSMIQVGADRALGAGLPRVGAAFSYTRSEADDLYGSSDADAYSLAGYGIWTWENGVFADLVARAATIETEMKEDGVKAETDNWLFSLSGELGARAVFAEHFYVEPSAELTYAWMKGDSFMTDDVKRELGDTESLIGRFGFAIGKSCPGGYGDLYLRAGLVHEFMGSSFITSTLGNTSRTIRQDGSDTWVEYAVGGNLNINKNAYVYVDLERTEGASLEEDWRANLGVRLSF